jgi:hypothetical protein
MQMMFVPQRKHSYRLPWLVTGVALQFYKQMMLVSHRKHKYGPPLSATGIALFFYMHLMFVRNEKHLQAFMSCYRDSFIFSMYMMIVPHRKYTYRPSCHVTEIALFYCI